MNRYRALVRKENRPEPLRLVEAWSRAVGPQLARVASPRGYETGRLLISVADSLWKKEIERQLPRILSRLRNHPEVPEILEVVLLVEPLPPVADSHKKSPGPTQASEAPPEEVVRAARKISDDEMARRWTRAVTRILSRVAAADRFPI